MPLAACDRCRKVFAVDHEVEDRTEAPVPYCPGCGGVLRPASSEDVMRLLARRDQPAALDDPDAEPSRACDARG
jgi:hypothetical protein